MFGKKLVFFIVAVLMSGFIMSCTNPKDNQEPVLINQMEIEIKDSVKNLEWLIENDTIHEFISFSDNTYYDIRQEGAGYRVYYRNISGEVIWTKTFNNPMFLDVDYQTKHLILSYEDSITGKGLFKLDSNGKVTKITNGIVFETMFDYTYLVVHDNVRSLYRISSDGTISTTINSIINVRGIKDNKIIVTRNVDGVDYVACFDFSGNFLWQKEGHSNYTRVYGNIILTQITRSNDIDAVSMFNIDGENEKTFTDNCKYYSSKSEDEIFLECGELNNSYIMRIDKTFNEKWRTEQAVYDYINVFDGEIYYTKNSLNTFFMGKINENGNVVFEVPLKGDLNEFYTVDRSGIYVRSETTLDNESLLQIGESYLYKYDHKGNEVVKYGLNERVFKQNLKDELLLWKLGNDGIYVLLYDKEGKLIWESGPYNDINKGFFDINKNTYIFYNNNERIAIKSYEGDTISDYYIVGKEEISKTESIYYVRDNNNNYKEIRFKNINIIFEIW